jgi:hypothetical protein
MQLLKKKCQTPAPVQYYNEALTKKGRTPVQYYKKCRTPVRYYNAALKKKCQTPAPVQYYNAALTKKGRTPVQYYNAALKKNNAERQYSSIMQL